MEDPRRPQGKFPNQGGFNHGNQMTGARIPQGGGGNGPRNQNQHQHYQDRNRGPAGQNQHNPDMDPVNWVKDLKATSKNCNLTVIVVKIDRVTRTNDGNEVRNVVVADKTGKVNFSVWGELGAALNEADILRITKAYTKIWKNQLTLYNSKNGECRRIGEFTLACNEFYDMSDPTRQWDVPAGTDPRQGYQRQKSIS